ncbi:hypothetical protein ACHAPU_000110 [Fusarium lateritium]
MKKIEKNIVKQAFVKEREGSRVIGELLVVTNGSLSTVGPGGTSARTKDSVEAALGGADVSWAPNLAISGVTTS